MKKLLILLLIVLIFGSISCGVLEDEWEHAKATCRKTKEYLKKYGIYDGVVNALTKGAKSVAQSVCEKKLPKTLCSNIVYVVGKITQKINNC